MQRDVRQIIKDAGGPEKISAASGKRGPAVSVKGVYNWVRIGIPEKHWPLLLKLSRASADELYRANRLLRNRPNSSARRAA